MATFTPYMLPEHSRKAEIPPTPLVEFALAYARSNWPVFPLHGKVPFKNSRGYKDATTNKETIHAWWTAHPTANIGLATGERSGILVLDIDPPEGYYNLKELQAAQSALPPTRTVGTGNKGIHYYFAYPNDGQVYNNVVGLQGKIGVDIRARGGYVVLPPSTLYGRLSYVWGNAQTPIAPLPHWLKEMILESQRQREALPQVLRFATSPGEYWLAQALTRAREGNRNDVGFWMACQLRDDRIPEAQARSIMLTYANLAPEGKAQYTSKEAIESVKQAYRRPPREPARRIHP